MVLLPFEVHMLYFLMLWVGFMLGIVVAALLAAAKDN